MGEDHSDLTQLNPVNFLYSTIRFGPLNTSFTTAGANNTIKNSNLNEKNLTWKDILNPNFDINVLLLNVNSIADEPREQSLGETELGENSNSFKRRRNDDHVSTSPNFTNNLMPGPTTADETLKNTLEGPNINIHTNSNETRENASTDSDLNTSTASNQTPSTNKPNTKPSYSRAASKDSNGQDGVRYSSNKNKKSKTNNSGVLRKIVNGQPKIEYSNHKRQVDSDGYTLVEPRNRSYKSRHKVTDSAISGIKSLSINNFAKGIEIVELMVTSSRSIENSDDTSETESYDESDNDLENVNDHDE
ncbi:unnamed protein product [Brachionus calyciflorus]|uniref:Uncharacterized protein n=1 Tax=Brachionus calyciflorus TaxID=104777 RepID=A0A814HL45_9BILA|nr:unnamed protein product [Brachionus calyciflorus]